MALNEYDSTRHYTKYSRHVNDSNERVNADTVNQIQSDVNDQQKEANKIKDTAFEERVYTIFNNNLFTNAMFIDYYKNGEYLNLTDSTNVKIDPERSLLTLTSGTTTGEAVSTQVSSVHGIDIKLNDFFLIANEYIPIGASIKYYLETYTGERWPITPNALKTPLHLTEDLEFGFKIITELNANSLGESPYVKGYAILYWDAKVEENYGLTNPDLARFP